MSSQFEQPITYEHKRVYYFVNAEPWNMYAITSTPKVQIKIRLILNDIFMKTSITDPNELSLSLRGRIITIAHMTEEQRRFGKRGKVMNNEDLEEFKTGAPLSFTPIGIPTPNSYWLQNGMYFATTPAVNAIYKTTKYDDGGYPYFYIDSEIKGYDKGYIKELSKGM